MSLFAVLGSCKKTETNTVIVTKNDTVTIIKTDTVAVVHDSLIFTNATLIGKWVNNDTLTFDGRILFQSHNGSVKYVTSIDTIYWFHTGDLSINAYYGYKISADNNTLTLYPTFTPLIYTYYRVL